MALLLEDLLEEGATVVAVVVFLLTGSVVKMVRFDPEADDTGEMEAVEEDRDKPEEVFFALDVLCRLSVAAC